MIWSNFQILTFWSNIWSKSVNFSSNRQNSSKTNENNLIKKWNFDDLTKTIWWNLTRCHLIKRQIYLMQLYPKLLNYSMNVRNFNVERSFLKKFLRKWKLLFSNLCYLSVEFYLGFSINRPICSNFCSIFGFVSYPHFCNLRKK